MWTKRSLHVIFMQRRKKILQVAFTDKVCMYGNLFIYLGFYIAFNTVQVISRPVVERAEETSTYSLLGLCTVNWGPTATNYQLSHLRRCQESNTSLRGGRRECYHSATVAPEKSVSRVRVRVRVIYHR